MNAIDDRKRELRKCLFCVNYIGERMCKAFADKPIPDDIWENEFIHNKRHIGDNGMVFDAAAIQAVTDGETEEG